MRTKHNSSGEKLEFNGDKGLSKKTKTEHFSFKRMGTASQQARVDVLDRGMVLSFFQSMMDESDQTDNQEGQGSPEKFTPIQEARVDEKERVFHIIDNRSLQRYTEGKVKKFELVSPGSHCQSMLAESVTLLVELRLKKSGGLITEAVSGKPGISSEYSKDIRSTELLDKKGLLIKLWGVWNVFFIACDLNIFFSIFMNYF